MSYQALLFCPDEKTARVVTQVLTELDFAVEPCNEPFAAVKKLMAQHFDAIVVDCDNEQNAGLLFKSARNSNSNQNSLSVAVVEGQAGVAKAFRIGANLVLTKPINVEQSKGTLRVARGLLRKAESSRPASPTAASPELSPKAMPVPSTPAAFPISPASFSKPTAAPLSPSPVPPTASASAAGLEVEPERTPDPEPAEAALLESMPDPVTAAGKVTPQSVSATRAPYPWQPVSKTAEPMATALKRAAEAASKGPETQDSPAQAPKSSSHASPVLGFPGLGTSSVTGAASAPAPAKEVVPTAAAVTPAIKDAFPAPDSGHRSSQTAIEPPRFAELAVKDHEEIAEGQSASKKPLVLVAIFVVLAVAAYFGWTKYHSAITSLVAGKSAAPTAVSAPLTQALPQPQQSSATVSTQPPAQQPDVTVAAAPDLGSKPSAGVKISEPVVAPDVTTHVTPSVQNEQPIIVKSTPNQRPAALPTERASAPAAPPVLMAGPSTADSKQIAGIVSPSSVPLPKAEPQSLRVSQGVSQGLIVKRVSPSYPQQAIQMRVQGAVQLEATVSKTGAVTNVRALKGDAILAHAAVDAVRQWKYKPYFLNGEPVEIQTEITVNFKLPQ